MPLTVTATPDNVTGTVRLDVTGGVPPYVADAAPAGGRPGYRVRTSWSGTAPNLTGVDGDLALNTDVLYVVTDARGDQAQTAVVRVVVDHALLAPTDQPLRALPVVVEAQKPNTWEARSVWWPVLGRRDPFVSVAPMLYRAGDLVLRVEDRATAATLLDLLAPGWPFLLRTPCPDAVDDVVGLPLTVTEALAVDTAPTGPTRWTLTYQAVSRELGPYAGDPGRTYATVVAQQATYADVLATFRTYAALLLGDPTAGLGAEQVTNGSMTQGWTGWEITWTTAGVAWDIPTGGPATATDDGTGSTSAFLRNTTATDQPIPAGTARRVRVTGKVRTSAPNPDVRVELLSNVDEAANYFAPGSVATPATLPAGAAWHTFTVELDVPNATHNRYGVYWRANGLPPGAVVEWRDLSVRWVTA